MPIYEYRCRKCGAEFEELSLSARAQTPLACRVCQSPQIDRLLSTFAVGADGGSAPLETGPCGACGAPRRGMCAAE
jgi:putative FmdB family regulatory protein